MKIEYFFIGAIALSFSLKTVSAQLPPADRVDRLHRELQWAVENENTEKARKITDLLIKELAQYRQQLTIDRERRYRQENPYKKPISNQNPQQRIDRERRHRQENPHKKPLRSHLDRDRPQFGKQLVLENSAAYSSHSDVCVTGQIRNNSRSPVENDIYAVAHFFDAQKRYLGSQTQQIDPQGILPNQTVDFDLTTSQPKQLNATVVKLQFKGTSSEGTIGLHPTNKSKMILPISSGTSKCVIR